MRGHGLAVTGLSAANIQPCNDFAVLHINHCVPNSFEFNRILKRVFHSVVFVAVPYNNEAPQKADYTVYSAARAGSAYIMKRNGSPYCSEDCPIEDAVRHMIFDAVKNDLIRYVECGKNIIIIEDGGYHYGIIDALIKEYPLLAEKIAGAVEQTMSGTRLAASCDHLPYPVFSIARSDYKIRYESGFVAGRVINAIDMMLSDIGEFPDYRSFLILGYGILGRAITLKLKSRFADIQVYDSNNAVMLSAENDGFEKWDGKFRGNDIVIGVTGNNSFNCGMMKSFLNGSSKRICLVSASSKQSEFSDVLSLVEHCDFQKNGNTRLYKYKSDKTIIIPADGFPINFGYSTAQALSDEMIDPLFAEMLILATTLTDLNSEFENKLYMLGCGSCIDHIVCENVIISQWAGKNGINADLENIHGHIHPCENILRREL